MKKPLIGIGFMVIAGMLSLTACRKSTQIELTHEPDLIVYTPLGEEIYKPILREFENRNDVYIEIHEESEEDIIAQLRMDKDKFPGDVVFGLSKTTVEENELLFSAVYDFSSSSLVIIYNTNIVTYKEIPDDFSSLLDERWKNRIGFVDPSTSTVYQGVLQSVQGASKKANYRYLDKFYQNIGNEYADSMESIAKGVCDGQYSVGIVTDKRAKSLVADGEDIAYVDLSDKKYIFTDVTATTLNSARRDTASEFLSFSVSNDVQKYLTYYLDYHPAKQLGEGRGSR